MSDSFSSEPGSRIQQIEDLLMRKEQSLLDKCNRLQSDLEISHERSSALENQIRGLKKDIALRDEKIHELNQRIDLNLIIIRQAQEELELCHLQYIEAQDQYRGSLKQQVATLTNTIIYRLRHSLGRILPNRVLLRGKRIADRVISSF